jgi:hypothetical protein
MTVAPPTPNAVNKTIFMANAPFMRHHFCTAADSVDIIAQRKNSVNKKAKGRPFLCLPSAGLNLW